MLRLAGVILVPAAEKAGATSGPRFFDVKNFGAAGDGKTRDTRNQSHA